MAIVQGLTQWTISKDKRHQPVNTRALIEGHTWNLLQISESRQQSILSVQQVTTKLTVLDELLLFSSVRALS